MERQLPWLVLLVQVTTPPMVVVPRPIKQLSILWQGALMGVLLAHLKWGTWGLGALPLPRGSWGRMVAWG